MTINPIAIAIPVFFLMILIELTLARRRGLKVYRFSDAITDLSCGVNNQVMVLLTTALLLGLHQKVYESWSLVRFAEGSLWPWVIGFVGVDFAYYWWHRLSHERNLMWAAHIVHHQSEDYNLAVALRQALFTGFTVIPFYLPLALLGVPAVPYAASVALSLLYQFWIHTELVDRLPKPLEYVLNTPSHHRVHHATNPQYLDKNYGGIFIVWDRLFGTFEPEVEPCTYGITTPLRSFNPLWANLHYWQEMFETARSAPSFARALGVLWARPGWDPVSNSVKPPDFPPRESFVKYEVPTPSRPLTLWISIQLGLIALALILLLSFTDSLTLPQLASTGLVIMLATVAWGGLLERRPWARALEALRVGAAALVAGWILLF